MLYHRFYNSTFHVFLCGDRLFPSYSLLLYHTIYRQISGYVYIFFRPCLVTESFPTVCFGEAVLLAEDGLLAEVADS